jgi:antitoxin PrlF
LKDELDLVRNFPYLTFHKEFPMPQVLEREAKITAKGQVTLPKPVRDALGVEEGDSIVYRLAEDGSVSVARAADSEEEAAVQAFLRFLSDDIKRHPEHVQPLSEAEIARWAALVEGVEVDLDDDFDGAGLH